MEWNKHYIVWIFYNLKNGRNEMSYNFSFQFLLYVFCIFNNTEIPFSVWPWVDGT
jgi:hypothetical protein